MNWVDNIVNTLDLIVDGVDPSTGEIIDTDTLKQNPEFQRALRALGKKYRSKSCGTFLVDDKGLSRGLTDTPPECRLRLRRRPVRVPFLQYIKQDTAQGGVLFYGGR